MTRTAMSRIERMISTCTVVLAISLAPATGKTIYVDDDAGGTNDGSSWTNAYVHLQDALGDAACADKPVEVLIAQGLYAPDQGKNQIPGDREASFQLVNGVTLLGGFAGLGGTYPDARDVQVYATILSGDLNRDDVELDDPHELFTEPTRSENSYHVVTSNNTDDTAALEGFIVVAGNSNGPELDDTAEDKYRLMRGGGMYDVLGSPLVANCTFTGNSASYGGGMSSFEGRPGLTDCTFVWNSVTRYGGGMFNSNSTPMLTNCTLSGNCAGKHTGGICSFGGMVTLTNCILWGNARHQISGNAIVSYSNIEGGWPGEGNLDVDPLFVRLGHLEGSAMLTDVYNGLWLEGDYHLRSQAGRWDPVREDWVTDGVSSPCIDAGAPTSAIGLEPLPNGGIINMGAYGGTAEASVSWP